LIGLIEVSVAGPVTPAMQIVASQLRKANCNSYSPSLPAGKNRPGIHDWFARTSVTFPLPNLGFYTFYLSSRMWLRMATACYRPYR